MTLQEAILLQQAAMEEEERVYSAWAEKLNRDMKDILTDNFGTQFLHNCGRDLAGEVVRNYFDTSDYHITVDQLVKRIFTFDYENDFDPLSKTEDLRKSVYNYTDLDSGALKQIEQTDKIHRTKLFDKISSEGSDGKTHRRYEDQARITREKRAYVDEKNLENGTIIDSYTGNEGEYVVDDQGNRRRRLEVDHVQALNAASVNGRYVNEVGREKLREFYNSQDNFALMDKSANASKGDVRVFDAAGQDITHKASPAQLADAICNQWEKDNGGEKIRNLQDKGYLNEEGKVPASIRRKLEERIKTSQNGESKVILKYTEYGQVAADAGKETANAIGKIIAGQILYFGAPSLIHEVKIILQAKPRNLDEILEKIGIAGKRIGKYMLAKMKSIFKNTAFNAVKKWVKTFMDILISLVKDTVARMVKAAKSVFLASIDALRILGDKTATRAEKADAVTSLYAVTLTNLAVDTLFTYLEAQPTMVLPSWMIKPLQILTSIVCMNLTQVVLQKADLFDVRHGFKMSQIESLFEANRNSYLREVESLNDAVEEKIQQVIQASQSQAQDIHQRLQKFNSFEDGRGKSLKEIRQLFSIPERTYDEDDDFLGEPS